MRKIALVSLIFFVGFCWGSFWEDQFGARPVGLGRAFVAIADDGYAPIWNPAGIELFKDRTLTATFSRLYWGVDNDILGQGYLSYIHHLGRAGSFALSTTQFISQRWLESHFILTYSKKISSMFYLGFNLRLIRNEVLLSGGEIGTQPGDESHGVVDPSQDPFLRDKSNKMGFTFDIGALVKPNDKLSMGIFAMNLNRPDMTFGDLGSDYKEPLIIRVGAAYDFHNRFRPAIDIRYLDDPLNGKKSFKPNAGVEYIVSRNLALRTGANTEELAFGFSYRNRKYIDIQFDYAFVYPLSQINKLGATSHKLSATMRFAPPPKAMFDLALKTSKMSVYPKNAIMNEKITIKATIENLGEATVNNFKVILYYEDPDKGWVLAAPVRTIRRKLKPGDSMELEWEWTPTKTGYYQFFARVDDDGIAIPKPHGHINEVDEDNNTGFVEFRVFSLPKGEAQPVETELQVSEVTLVREEEPIVPVVFFDPMDDRVDERFNRMLSLIAERLKNNPDIEVTLYGYFNPESDGDVYEYGEKLARSRAKAVRSVLLRFEPTIIDQVKLANTQYYDPSRSRCGKIEEHLPKDKPLAEAENRRTEMIASVRGFENWKPVIFFDKNSSEVDLEALQTLRAEADNIKRIMERNPEAIFLVTGYAGKGEQSPVRLAFDRAFKIRSELENILGTDFVNKFSRRIFIYANTDKLADRGKATIQVTGEGLLYRPMEGKWAAKDYEFQKDKMNFVVIKTNVEAGVDSFRVSVIDDKGNIFRVLAEGSGRIPEGIPWDWHDAHGNLITPDRTYYVQLEIKDRLGQRMVRRSKPIKVNVQKLTRQVETLILVQFVFDEKTSESVFQESRLEYIARRFIRKALEPHKKLIAEIAGHTDIIGMEFRNRQLAEIRAKKEYENLRFYLIYLLGLKNNTELNRWLAAHNTVLKYAGYASKKPYVVTVWRKNKLVKKLVGNNKFPEGRVVNRRVTIEFYEEKIGTKSKTTGETSLR